MNPPPRRRDQPLEPEPGRLSAFLAEHRAGLSSLVIVAAALGVGMLAWGRLGDRVKGRGDLVLLPEQVTVEGVAPWVRSDLAQVAIRDASLAEGMPLDDPELVRRLARAFAIQPWVREVVSVEIQHPPAARVRIRCREPVAMVAVPGGLLAVDAEAVVLPSDDFTAESAAAYPRITGVASGPQGAVGFPWGDTVVEQGAALATAIGPDWKPLGLVECREAVGSRGHSPGWELVDEQGRVIHFGAAPGHETAGEPTAAVKIARLRGLAPARGDGPVDLTTAPAAGNPGGAIPAPAVTTP
ncbi:MAG: cell division protein FtsQ/DivIB [Pirellulales bacterium]